MTENVELGGIASADGNAAIAGVDIASGSERWWHWIEPTSNGLAHQQLAASTGTRGGRLCTAGTDYVFQSYGGNPRSNLAALDAVSRRATGWKPSLGLSAPGARWGYGWASALLADAGRIFVGGYFEWTNFAPGAGSKKAAENWRSTRTAGHTVSRCPPVKAIVRCTIWSTMLEPCSWADAPRLV